MYFAIRPNLRVFGPFYQFEASKFLQTSTCLKGFIWGKNKEKGHGLLLGNMKDMHACNNRHLFIFHTNAFIANNMIHSSCTRVLFHLFVTYTICIWLCKCYSYSVTACAHDDTDRTEHYLDQMTLYPFPARITIMTCETTCDVASVALRFTYNLLSMCFSSSMLMLARLMLK